MTVTTSRMDFVNLRGITASQVQFVGCRIGELDLGQSRLRAQGLAPALAEHLGITVAEAGGDAID